MRALLAAFAWGFAEATLFFVVPDVLIGWLALRRFRTGLDAVLAAAVGATLGGAVVYLFAPAFLSWFAYVPGITAGLVADCAARLREAGWAAIVAGPLGGIPYKVWAAEAAVQGLPLIGVVLVTPVARIWRFAAVALVAGLAGRVFRSSVRDNAWAWLAIYAGLWMFEYALYFRELAERYG